MNDIYKIICLSIVGILSFNTVSAENITNQKVNSVGTDWGAGGIIVTTVATNSFGGCGPNYMISNNPAHPLMKEMLSILLSAYHTGDNVNLYVDGCINNFMNLKSVTLLK